MGLLMISEPDWVQNLIIRTPKLMTLAKEKPTQDRKTLRLGVRR